MLPGNIDVFNWSYPLIWEKVLTIMEVLLMQGFDDTVQLEAEDSQERAYQDAVLLRSLNPIANDEERLELKLRGFKGVVSKVR